MFKDGKPVLLCECNSENGRCKHEVPYYEAEENYIRFCFTKHYGLLISKDCPNLEKYRASHTVLAEGEHYIIVDISKEFLKEKMEGPWM